MSEVVHLSKLLPVLESHTNKIYDIVDYCVLLHYLVSLIHPCGFTLFLFFPFIWLIILPLHLKYKAL